MACPAPPHGRSGAGRRGRLRGRRSAPFGCVGIARSPRRVARSRGATDRADGRARAWGARLGPAVPSALSAALRPEPEKGRCGGRSPGHRTRARALVVTAQDGTAPHPRRRPSPGGPRGGRRACRC
ncbi:MAG: hypothetical protein AVDCRST_MAG08-529 [uncultured Acetobacteraceae bacterium]|uniref:Uncharacterized protein n=1 Tax=uncultured Acetobacteraceae bacterium TaxID=169975 RepID=A0A6J4HAA7_9PROT|nr:MAG: hypothetical protein AVDCRST_MAG08-529 [uncultured Acetobacteraceae bacterium]